MDRVFIEGLDIEAIIGVHDWERTAAQPLLVDIGMSVDASVSAGSDAVDDTVDYAAVAEAIGTLAAQSRHQLIETFAEEVAAMILGRFGPKVSEVTVCIRKPRAIPNARNAGIEITRSTARAGLSLVAARAPGPV